MWVLVQVETPQDVGRNEKARFLLNDEIVTHMLDEQFRRVHPATPEKGLDDSDKKKT